MQLDLNEAEMFEPSPVRFINTHTHTYTHTNTYTHTHTQQSIFTQKRLAWCQGYWKVELEVGAIKENWGGEVIKMVWLRISVNIP